MPLKVRSNNRILPANSRAADVATKGIQEIIPVQQARYYNAFVPQGISCVLYNILTAGRKCTCNAGQKQLAGRLDNQGKADVGTINSLLTGSPEFNIDTYGASDYRRNPEHTTTSPFAPVNLNQGVFNVKTKGAEFPSAEVVTQPGFGDNGAIDPGFDIDTLVRDFDAPNMGIMDTNCSVCFGTGFVGGYSAFQGHRHVITVADVQLADGDLDVSTKPWSATGQRWSVVQTLPHGAIGVDSLRVFNKKKVVGARVSIDGQQIQGVADVLRACDGRPHLIAIAFDTPTQWTHMEFQFSVTTESTFFEFPRLNSSSDTAKLDPTDPFQIVLSPNVPVCNPMDIICESQNGRTLIVQNVNTWESRQRNVLGWECQVRVLQQPEAQRLLPFRGRVMAKDQTTNSVKDNVTGRYRT